MIALMQLLEDYCQAGQCDRVDGCCEELKRLAEKTDMQNATASEKAHARAIAQICRGTRLLCQGDLEDAVDFFSRSQHSFQEAGTPHSRGVASMAFGIAQQRRYEAGIVFEKDDFWAETLDALQASLATFRNLGDRLQVDVRKRLAEIRERYQEDLATRRTFANLKVTVQPSTAKGRDRAIPIEGRIAAGGLVLITGITEGYIVVDKEIADRADYALKVDGNSMVNAAILDGDLVFMQKTEAKPANGQIAAVMVSDMSDRATLKRFYDEGDHVLLVPANDDYPLIVVNPNSLPKDQLTARHNQRYPGKKIEVHSEAQPSILGWVVAVIRKEV